jgi:hypothetical protein
LEKIIILQDFREHQEGENASPSQEEPYISTCKSFKIIACLVQELWLFKVELTNCDIRSTQQEQYAAAAAVVAVAHWVLGARFL